MENKYYSVQDIAKVTGLTSRTIRNYIKDGKLKGKKIGSQWRFTEEDVKSLFNTPEVSGKIKDFFNKSLNDLLDSNRENEQYFLFRKEVGINKYKDAKSLMDNFKEFLNEEHDLFKLTVDIVDTKYVIKIVMKSSEENIKLLKNILNSI